MLGSSAAIETMCSCKAAEGLMACEPGVGTCLSATLLRQGWGGWLWHQGNAGLCGCDLRPGLDCAKLERVRCLTGGFCLSLCKGPGWQSCLSWVLSLHQKANEVALHACRHKRKQCRWPVL